MTLSLIVARVTYTTALAIKVIAANRTAETRNPTAKIPSTNAYWVVDPLDGTTNFAAGIPYWAISIARFVEGKPQTAILDIPPLKKRIIAIKNKGVWINNKKRNERAISSKRDRKSVV